MAETKVIELDVKTNLGSLKSQLKQAQAEVQNLADKFGATSAQAIEAAKRAADLKDRIGDAKSLTDAFNPDAKFKALSGSLTGVASGFSAVTGAMGAFGKENEDVEKALLKVQSAMAMSQGLQGLGEARDSFKQFGGVLKDTFKNLSSESSLIGKSTSALGPIWKTVGLSGKSALSGIRAGIAATGIGLLVIALGAVVAYWDDIKAAISGVSKEQEQSNAKAHLLVESSSRLLKNYDNQNNVLKLQGKTDKQILQGRIAIEKQAIKNAQKEIELLIETRKAQKAANEERFSFLMTSNKMLLKFALGAIDFIAKPLDFLIGKINSVSKQLGFGEIKLSSDTIKESLNDYYKNFEKLNREYGLGLLAFSDTTEFDAKIKEAKDNLTALKNESAGTALNIMQIDKEGTEKALESNQDKLDKLKAQEEEYQQSLKDAQLVALNDTLSQDEIEINAVKEKYQKQLDLAKSLKKDTAVIEEAMGIEINAIRKKYADELETLPMLPIAPIKVAATELVGIAKKATQEELDAFVTLAETKMAIRDADFDNASAGIDLISKLFEGNKKVQAAALIAENALAIAKTIIATKASNQAARASGTALSIATAGASVVTAEALVLRNNIGAGISIAGIIAATGKGLSALKAGGSPTGGDTGGGGGGGGGGGAVSPSFNVVGNSGINQLGQLQQRPTKAYVVSGDMSTAQSLDRNRIENATLVQ
jgi:hypothetical protein